MTKNKDSTIHVEGEMVAATPTTVATMGPDISHLMEVALSQGEGGVAALEKLVHLQERIDDREAEKAYARAMLHFQNACPTIVKVKDGYKGNYKYAPLEYVMATIGPELQRNGLSVSWETDTSAKDGHLREFTIIRHVEGHREKFAGPLFPLESKTSMMSPQQVVGSTQSYARRYGVLAALGVTTGGEDNDGAAPPAKFLTDDQVATLDALIDETKSDRTAFLKFAKADELGLVPQSQYQKLVHMLQAKR